MSQATDSSRRNAVSVLKNGCRVGTLPHGLGGIVVCEVPALHFRFVRLNAIESTTLRWDSETTLTDIERMVDNRLVLKSGRAVVGSVFARVETGNCYFVLLLITMSLFLPQLMKR